MPRLPDQPRTRVEEVMRARGITQTELAERSGWMRSTVSRIALGHSQLTPHSQAVLARLLGVDEHMLHEPMGSPIPPRRDRPQAHGALDQRVQAVVTVFGLEDGGLEGLLRFIATGDYGGLRPELARRLKEALGERP